MPRGFGTCRVGEARWRDDAVEQALALLDELGYHGIAQTEFRQDARDGELRLMEVNPRLWQWHGLARACGVDLPRIAYEDTLGRPPAPVALGPRARRDAAGSAAVAHLRCVARGGRRAFALRSARCSPRRRDRGDVRPARPAADAVISAGRPRRRLPCCAGPARVVRRSAPGDAPRPQPLPLDVLLLATLTVTTWAKIHWQFAGQVALEDILAIALPGRVRVRPARPRATGGCREARRRCSSCCSRSRSCSCSGSSTSARATRSTSTRRG